MGGQRAPESIAQMQSIYLEDERGIEGAKTELFALPGGSCGARSGPRKKFRKSQGATEMAASSIHFIFTVSRDHLDEGRKALKQKFVSSVHFRKKPFSKSMSIDGSNPCI